MSQPDHTSGQVVRMSVVIMYYIVYCYSHFLRFAFYFYSHEYLLSFHSLPYLYRSEPQTLSLKVAAYRMEVTIKAVKNISDLALFVKYVIALSKVLLFLLL